MKKLLLSVALLLTGAQAFGAQTGFASFMADKNEVRAFTDQSRLNAQRKTQFRSQIAQAQTSEELKRVLQNILNEVIRAH